MYQLFVKKKRHMPITEIGSKHPEAPERGISGKVRCTVKNVKFTLQQAVKAQGGMNLLL